MTDPSYFVVIPAAGKGARFSPSGDTVKQHANLLGKSILQRAIEPFISHEKIKYVVVVLSPDESHPQWVDSDIEHQKLSFQRVGGSSRAESVLNGIRSLGTLAGPADWILVHDAVRPLITRGLIDLLMDELTNDSEGGLLACRLVDTIKNSNECNRVTSTVDRKHLWAAQTPQMFRRATLERALSMTIDRSDITDESSAIETLGINPLLVESDSTNFKITYAHDLDRAKLVLTKGTKTKGTEI
ncbi:2-C-methyl-D-erythritol 4-phosphate cytidylyltransferase [Burkholderiales bacterium]|nr:2-C-methyl-D-erythritol 4-phosphate cytidylyltransferase [Burkholderiales bacterium]